MEVRLRVAAEADEVTVTMRSLEAWLAGRDELRGRVRPVVAAPQPGAMGSVADVLMVALGQGGVATALASVLISWVRRQTGKVSVSAKLSDGAEITLTADHVRGLSTDEISPLVAQLAAALESRDARKLDGGGTVE